MRFPRPTRPLHGLVAVAAALLALSGLQDAAADGLSPDLPHDVAPDATPDDFESFSWQSFVALNWPAGRDGEPLDVAIGSDPGAWRVWQFYPTPDAVFLPDGQRPRYEIGEPIPDACRRQLPDERLAKLRRVVRMTSKASQAIAGVNSDMEAVVNRPLIDQNLNFIVVEIRLNPDEFRYIVRHGFYDAGVQKALKAKAIELPAGSIDGEVGAIEIKVAWRFLDAERDRDILGRYYTERVPVYVHPQNTLDGKPLCIPEALLGMVGFHISHKTRTRPEWIWSTFEQVDNVARGPGLPAHRTPTLRDPRCNDRYMCPVNQVPPSPFGWSPVEPYAIEVAATQVVRTIGIPERVRRINEIWQEKLRRAAPESVWQYYELVGTQWPSKPEELDPAQLQFGDPVPTVLSNTTMETYLQPTSSCIGCHGGRATLAENDHTFPDFTFLLAHACQQLDSLVTALNRPCAALVLGAAGAYGESEGPPRIEGVEIGPGVRWPSRQIEVTNTAGSFELVCDVQAAASEVDLTISTAEGAVAFDTGTTVRVGRGGRSRFPLEPPGAASPAVMDVSFMFHNQGSTAVRASCTVEPF